MCRRHRKSFFGGGSGSVKGFDYYPCSNDVSTYSMNTVISIIQELFHLCFNELKKYSVDELSVCGLVGIIGRK